MTNSFKKEEWYYYGRWVQPVLSGSFWTPWYEAKCVAKVFPGIEFNQVLFFDGYTWGTVIDQRNVATRITDLLHKEKLGEFNSRLQREAAEVERRHLAILNSNKDLTEYVKDLFNTYKEIIGIWTIGFNFDPVVTNLIIQGGVVKKVDDLLPLIEKGVGETWLQKQNREIRRLVREIKKVNPNVEASEINTIFLDRNPKPKSAFERHVEEFIWFGTHHWTGKGYSLELCLTDVRQELDRKIERKSAAVNQRTGLPPHPLLDLLSILTYWRTHCAELTSKVVFASRQKLSELASSFGLTYDELLWFSHEEILEGMKSGRLNKALIAIRKEGYGTCLDEGKEKIVMGKELTQLVQALLGKIEDTSELRGMVASRGGVIRGRARIIISPEDIPKFKKGEIMVAPETTPDFVPLMKIASAIVTEAGGITSHAAIVSRELGVPCIVGTKIATRVLKDGDLVEVDAERGVVKIIKHANVD